MSQASTTNPPVLSQSASARELRGLSRRGRNRIVAAIIFAACTSLLLFASYLDPEPNAQGQQTDLSSFGYPGCGFKQTTGLPCMTCGMTTTFSYMADGRFVEGFATQPAGALLALGVAALAMLSGLASITGASLAGVSRRFWRAPVVITALAILVGAWTYNIAMTAGVSI